MHTQIKNVGLANGVKSTGKTYSLSDMIQESFRVSYKAKELKDPAMIRLTEAHLMRVKKNPTDPHLNGDLEVLCKLANSGKPIKLSEVKKPAKEAVNKATNWSSKSLNEGLSNFKSTAKSKVFFKELEKLHKPMTTGKLSMDEAVTLYKAVNSCMTHLTVELEKNPGFRKVYTECTTKLGADNAKLLESIQKGVSPDKTLLKSYLNFSKALHECDAPSLKDEDTSEELTETVDLPTEEPADVIKEEVDLPTEEPVDVINEDDDITNVDNDPIDESVGDEDSSVDLTPDEIKVLKSILDKIARLDAPAEEDDAPELPDPEEPIVNEEDEVTLDKEDEDIPVDEDIPDDEPIEDEPIDSDIPDDVTDEETNEDVEIPVEDDDTTDDLEEDEGLEEPVDPEIDECSESEGDPASRLVKLNKELNEVIDQLTGDTDGPEDKGEDLDECGDPESSGEETLDECGDPESSDEEDELDVSITEAIKRRIKKCF